MRSKLLGLSPILILAVCVVWIVARAQVAEQQVGAEPQPEAQQQAQGPSLMVQKLSMAQGLLTSLAVSDFDAMKEEAEELTQISLKAQWSAPYSSAYGKYGDDFRDAMASIVKSADGRNIDGAALGYVQMVFACVNCHDVVRDRQGVAMNLEEVLRPGAVLESLQSAGE